MPFAALGIRPGSGPDFVLGATSVVVGTDGSFAWQRRLNPAKAIAVYVATDIAQSNVATLPPTR